MNKIIKIILLFILLSTTYIYASDNRAVSLTGWVGLWNDEMVNWAENQNRINKICPNSMGNSSYNICKQDNLAIKTWHIPAYKSSNKHSEKVGSIIITVKPGNSFSASFKNKKGIIRDFKLDLFNSDWGYGPYFHQTYLEKLNNWIKIPIEFYDFPVWINPQDSINQLDIINVSKNIVYMLGKQSILITKIKDDVIFFRLEQKADMWCDVGNPPKLKKAKIKKIKIKELYDSHMHLKIDIKYKRGC